MDSQTETWQDFTLFSPPGERAIFSTLWGDFLNSPVAQFSKVALFDFHRAPSHQETDFDKVASLVRFMNIRLQATHSPSREPDSGVYRLFRDGYRSNLQ